MTATWQTVGFAALGASALATALASIYLAARAGKERSGGDSLARRVEELAARIRTLEVERDEERRSRALAVEAAARRAERVETREVARGVSTPAVAPAPTRERIFTAPPPMIPRQPEPVAPTLIAVPTLPGPGTEAAASEAGERLGRRFGQIWNLADAGEPPRAIAEATGYPVGEVELILGLRRPAFMTSAPAPGVGEAVGHV